MGSRKKILALFGFLALALPLTGCDNPEQKEARYIRHGNALFEKEEFEKARIEYKNAAKIKPTDAEPIYRIGLVDEQEGDLRNAFSNFTAAEQQDVHYHPAALKVAQYFLGAQQLDEARKRIDATLSEDPNDAEAHALSAALLLREKKLDGAEAEARIALAKDPANVSACSALTGIYSAKGEPQKAVTVINDGIERNPKNLALLLLRVILFEKANDLPKIAESYQAIFKLKPDQTQFRVNLAEEYIKANKLDEAETSLRNGMAALPDNWEMKHQLVLFLAEHRSPAIAEAEIRKLMEAYPKNDDLYFWLADLYVNTNATDKAVDLLNQIVDRGQYDAPALNARTLLARISIKRGNRDLANKLVAAVLAKAPDNRAALLVRASMAFDNGYTQSAVSDLRTIVRNTPNDKEALQLLGETLLLQGHLDLAIDTMKKLTDLDPTNLAARVRLAQVIHLNGDTKQAMELISLVTKAAPAYAIGWESAARFAIDAKEWLPAENAIGTLDKLHGQHLTASYLEGQVLESNGKSEEAIAKYMEVINADPETPLAEHALKSLLDAYNKLNRIDAAARYLETLKTNSPLVSVLIGKCYAIEGKTGESAAAYDKAIKANAAIPDAYLDRAHLSFEEHKMDEALDVLKKGTAAVPNDFRAPLNAASLLGSMGKYREAIAMYDDILARNPGLDVAANNLAEMIADNEYNDSAALEKARNAAERFSGSTNPLLLDTLGWVYFRQGNLPQAQTILERAIGLGGALPPQLHYHYGAILLKSGKTDKAKAELELAVAKGAAYPGIEDAKKLLDSQ
jgi:tetratricopeptide (TPR) repeat protein